MKKQLNVEIDKSDLGKIRTEARRESKSVNSVVWIALNLFLSLPEPERKRLLAKAPKKTAGRAIK